MIIIPALKDCKYIPLKDYSKIPIVKWNTDDVFEIDHEAQTWAIDTGRSNLIVIDCDNHSKDNDGIEKFLLLCDENDYRPNTFTVETPNDGMHFYYKTPDNVIIKCSNSQIWGNSIDIKASGGYIVAPGSKVKDNDGNIKEYIASDDNSVIEELPHWILQDIISHQNKKLEAHESLKTSMDFTKIETLYEEPKGEQEEIERGQALSWALTNMKTTFEGKRQETLNSLSYFMGCKRVSPDKAAELIEIAIQQGLTQQEAENTFHHGYTDGLKQNVEHFENIVRQFNAKAGISYKDDPNDPEFYSHFALAANFKKMYDTELIYWDSDKNWYQYNAEKGIWEILSEVSLQTMVREFIEKLLDDLRSKNKKFSAAIYKAQERILTRNQVDNISSIAKTYFNKRGNIFDQNSYLINCKNGTYDIEKQKMLPHSMDFLITKYIPFDLDLNATDIYCDRILECVPEEVKDYLQVVVGQSLIGEQPRSQTAHFLYGTGSNGKSTFLDLLLRTSGTYGKLQPPNVLINDAGKENYAMADFEGLRTAVVEELPDSKFLNAGALKRLVGTQKINSRKIYSSHREFYNETTILISCNRLPMVNETDRGTWRRMRVIPFPYTYVKNKDEIKNDNYKMGDSKVIFYAQKRRQTAEAFLAWRIKGAIKWFNNFELEDNVPQIIDTYTNDWHENNDLVLSWFNSNLISDKTTRDYFITITDLFNSYNDWIIERGNSKISMRNFIDIFKSHTIFTDNKLIYVKQGFIKKDYIQSSYITDSGEIKPLSKHPTFILGLRFKED